MFDGIPATPFLEFVLRHILLRVMLRVSEHAIGLGDEDRHASPGTGPVHGRLCRAVHRDDIVTVGGIYGRVTAVTDDDVTIDVGGGTELRLARRAIAERIGDDAE